MRKKIVVILCLFVPMLYATALCKEPEKEVYMFSYFTGEGEDGLHLAYSYDGLNWQVLEDGKSFLAPQVGRNKLMRDPSIAQGPDGVFHLVWTTGWWDEGIGYASSKDLVNWSEQQNIPVMENIDGTRNTWAPEVFYDETSETFYILWSSTVTGAFPDSPVIKSDEGLDHRQYYVSTKDFKTFTNTSLYFDPGFCVIDGTVLKKDSTYYLFVKNENYEPAEKNIRVTYGHKPYDFPAAVSEPITGDYWAEGPSAIVIGEYTYVYFDKYMVGRYGAVRSKDMVNWEDVSDQITFPSGARHGTAFKVSQKILESIQSKK